MHKENYEINGSISSLAIINNCLMSLIYMVKEIQSSKKHVDEVAKFPKLHKIFKKLYRKTPKTSSFVYISFIPL